MASLRQHFESLAFSGVATFIASGNVSFETAARSARALEAKIEQKLRKALGYEVGVYLRTPAELVTIANHKPFGAAEPDAAAKLYVAFVREPLDARATRAVEALPTGMDRFRVRGREIYWLRSRKPEALPYSTLALEKALGVPFTVRGIDTVRRMARNLK